MSDKKFYFESRFLVGLYLYLRQIDLSIDRAFRPESWEGVIDFFSGRTDVDAVRAQLEKRSGISFEEHISMDAPVQPERGPDGFSLPVFLRLVYAFFRPRGFLTYQEVVFTYNTLTCFSRYLRMRPSNEELIKLRAALCLIEEILDQRIAASKRTKRETVEMFNRNPELPEARSLEAILGSSWPGKEDC